MSEPICPVKDCDPEDCAKCDGLPPFEECVYVSLYRGIQSGEFQRDKGRPFKDIVREIEESSEFKEKPDIYRGVEETTN